MLTQLNPPALARESDFFGVPELGAGGQGDVRPAPVEWQVFPAGAAAAGADGLPAQLLVIGLVHLGRIDIP